MWESSKLWVDNGSEFYNLKNGWLRMKLECIVYLIKVRPLLLKDLIVH